MARNNGLIWAFARLKKVLSAKKRAAGTREPGIFVVFGNF
jgi:hypothetical protein